MPDNEIIILSTRPLPGSLIKEAAERHIAVDVLSFIETEVIQSIEIQQEIEAALLQSGTVIFTSMNAVEAVANEIGAQVPEWNVYCIGNTTQKLVKEYFGEGVIAGTADSAGALAERIIEDGTGSDEVIFFCGDQRRDELPDLLRSHDIEVNEIVVYQTIRAPQKIEKFYYGILFFSPSAVESFFENNKLPEQTILFAIGNTTATAIRRYSNNKIIIADEPGKENLFRKMMEYFGQW